ARRVLLPVASSPAFSGFILRGGLAAFDLLTRPNRVYSITAHVFAARVLASSITGTHSRLATCRTGNYIVNSFQSTRSARLILAYRASASGPNVLPPQASPGEGLPVAVQRPCRRR